MGLSITSDQEILRGIRSRELDATIPSIYRLHAESVTAFVVQQGGSREDGEDIFQETVLTFIDLVQQGKFREASSVKTFLHSIARNIWLNEWKKKQRLDERGKVFENRKEVDGEADIADILHQRQVKALFQGVLDQIGETCKTLLTLFYYDGLSYREILGRLPYQNEQVLRNQKHKCMQSLVTLLRDQRHIIDFQ